MNYFVHESGKIWQTEIPKETPLAMALGCFDGIHIGHQALMRAVTENGKGYASAIWTFSQPLTLPYIEKVEDRIKLCAKIGVNYAVCEDYAAFKDLTPEAFINHLHSRYNVKLLVCGEDFRFGHDRAGDASFLKSEAEKLGIEVCIVPAVMCEVDGKLQKVSSTLIRSLINDGRVDIVCTLLGRPFSITGVVVSGNNLGRTIQVPTLNQRLEKCRITPKCGVYDTVCEVNGGRYPSVTNVGTRPTVVGGSHEMNCETHIIDEHLDIYGEIASVQFYNYIRTEAKFASLQELREQIGSDIKHSVEFFKNKDKQ